MKQGRNFAPLFPFIEKEKKMKKGTIYQKADGRHFKVDRMEGEVILDEHYVDADERKENANAAEKAPKPPNGKKAPKPAKEEEKEEAKCQNEAISNGTDLNADESKENTNAEKNEEKAEEA